MSKRRYRFGMDFVTHQLAAINRPLARLGVQLGLLPIDNVSFWTQTTGIAKWEDE